jgi:hypothetical protein
VDHQFAGLDCVDVTRCIDEVGPGRAGYAQQERQQSQNAALKQRKPDQTAETRQAEQPFRSCNGAGGNDTGGQVNLTSSHAGFGQTEEALVLSRFDGACLAHAHPGAAFHCHRHVICL